MNTRKPAEDLTIDELRALLLQKRRADRRSRLEHFRKTGRVLQIVPDAEPGALTPAQVMPLTAEPIATTTSAPPLPKSAPRRRWYDNLLLLVEISAVIGLALIVLSSFNLLQAFNREMLGALQQPTLSPTPLISAVVLPSGHTPPNAPGGARPNDAEIPEHLRPLVQSLANIPVPTPGPEQAIRIQIPAIGVDAPIVQGDGWEQLKKGVGQHLGSADPGQKGNVVLSAHNDIFGEIFRDLDRLQPGDQIILFTNQRSYVYTVSRTLIVEPTQVEVLSPTRDATTTLISCYPYMVNNQRIVIQAQLQNSN
ncbi:MAG: hypothetical protein OHK0052_27210 [Anaerolineales bacterium]